MKTLRLAMLERSFIHLPGVGPKREIALWRAGIHTWQDFLDRGRSVVGPALYAQGRPVVERCLAACEGPGGLAELAPLFPAAEHWRFWPRLDRVVYLDIETGGMPEEWGGITVVGLWDSERLEQLVANHNMSSINNSMIEYDVVCTFSGTSFDIPVLKKNFPLIHIPPLHIDLRFLLKRLGITGGLKRIEKRMGINRPEEVADMDGYGAVRLWQNHLAGDLHALDILLAYNAQDVLNLPQLLSHGVNQLTHRLAAQGGWEFELS
jgi:hypothetical protein